MVVWFVVLGVLGLRQIVAAPGVLRADQPDLRRASSSSTEPGKAFLALGLDLPRRHRRRGAVRRHGPLRPPPDPAVAGTRIVLPALLLNYFGQAALLAGDPGERVESPFFRLAPEWAVTPLAVLATMATVIASQALISGAFSLTAQAVQLDYLPRLDDPPHVARRTSGRSTCRSSTGC